MRIDYVSDGLNFSVKANKPVASYDVSRNTALKYDISARKWIHISTVTVKFVDGCSTSISGTDIMVVE